MKLDFNHQKLPVYYKYLFVCRLCLHSSAEKGQCLSAIINIHHNYGNHSFRQNTIVTEVIFITITQPLLSKLK